MIDTTSLCVSSSKPNSNNLPNRLPLSIPHRSHVLWESRHEHEIFPWVREPGKALLDLGHRDGPFGQDQGADGGED